jgi:hypothetical protein
MFNIRGLVNLPNLQGTWDLISVRDNTLMCVRRGGHIILGYDIKARQVVRLNLGKWEEPKTWFMANPKLRRSFRIHDPFRGVHDPTYNELTSEKKSEVERMWWRDLIRNLPKPDHDDPIYAQVVQGALDLKDSAKSGDFVKDLQVDGYTSNFKLGKDLVRRGIFITENGEPRTFEQLLCSITTTQSE